LVPWVPRSSAWRSTAIPPRLGFLALLIVSIVGLKLTSAE